MTTATSRMQSTETFAQKFLGYVLSDRTRKMIFLSSLAGYIQNITNPDNQMVEKINELFSLSRNPSALKLPIQMNAKIWSAFDQSRLVKADLKGVCLSDVCDTRLSIPQLRIVANQLIDSVPKWLIYGSREAMRQDIYKLLQAPSQTFQPSPVTS